MPQDRKEEIIFMEFGRQEIDHDGYLGFQPIRACLDAVKDDFYNSKYSGLACAIKNSGVGNGMNDESKVIIEVVSDKKIILQHGWTEMGQGVHNMALQTLCEETGVNPEIIRVVVDTDR